MEVKIKNGNEIVEYQIEIVDGVIVVSPKEVKFEPKDGDILIGGNRSEDTGNYWIFILKGEIKDEIDGCMSANEYASVEKSGSLEIDSDSDSMKWYRPATEKEKKKLFDKLAKEGYEWKPDTKELVKLKWKPKEHEKVYVAGFTFYGNNPFCVFEDTAYSGSMQWRAVFDRGWYFKTEQECQEFCNRLNDAINSVKL